MVSLSTATVNKMMPTHHAIGTRVVVTEENMRFMRNSNRSCMPRLYVYPCDSFIAKLAVGMTGEVTHTFLPGYEVTVKMDNGQHFHMKDNWITPA